MAICDLNNGAGRLLRSTKRLKDAWAMVRQDWDDATSNEFAKKFLDPLGPQVQLTLAAIGEIVDSFEEAERACRDEECDTY